MSAIGSEIADSARLSTCSFDTYLEHFVPVTDDTVAAPRPIYHDHLAPSTLPQACVRRFVEPILGASRIQPLGVRLPQIGMRHYGASIRATISESVEATIVSISHPTAAYIALITYSTDGSPIDEQPVAGRRDLHVSLAAHSWIAPSGEFFTVTGGDDASWFRVSSDGTIVAADETQIASRDLLRISGTRQPPGPSDVDDQ